ncbi:chromosome partitioning protein [Rhizobium sp. Leaf262]|nr:chromosome partitioning protein [Rhizobium sp. Leaf262]
MHSSSNLSLDHTWKDLEVVDVDGDRLERSHIVTLHRSDPTHATFDMMRTKTLQTLKKNEWTSIAITSPTPLCGKTTVALNLAFSLSHQLDCRTVLIDFNMKTPGFEQFLGVSAPFSIQDFLCGSSSLEQAFVRFGENLAIGTTSKTAEFSAELLQSSETARVLREMKSKLAPDVIIYDMPKMLGGDDVTAFLPNVDCALLVAAAEHSTFDEIDRCERHLSERTNLLGVVLNKCLFDVG